MHLDSDGGDDCDVQIPRIISLNFQIFTIYKQTTPWYERDTIVSPVESVIAMLTISSIEVKTIFAVIHVAVVVPKASSHPIKEI